MGDDEDAGSWLVRLSSDNGATRYVVLEPEDKTFKSLRECVEDADLKKARYLFAGYGDWTEESFESILYHKCSRVIIGTDVRAPPGSKGAAAKGAREAQPEAAARDTPPAKKAKETAPPAGQPKQAKSAPPAQAPVDPMLVDTTADPAPAGRAPERSESDAGASREPANSGVRGEDAMETDAPPVPRQWEISAVPWTKNELQQARSDAGEKRFLYELFNLLESGLASYGNVIQKAVCDAATGKGSFLIPTAAALNELAQSLNRVDPNDGEKVAQVLNVLQKYTDPNDVPGLLADVDTRTLHQVAWGEPYETMKAYVYLDKTKASNLQKAICDALGESNGGGAASAAQTSAAGVTTGQEEKGSDDESGGEASGDDDEPDDMNDPAPKRGGSEKKSGKPKAKAATQTQITAERAFAEIVRFAAAVALCNYEGVEKDDMENMVNKMPPQDRTAWEERIREAPSDFSKTPAVYFSEDLDYDIRAKITEYHAEVVANKRKNFLAIYPLWRLHKFEEGVMTRVSMQSILSLIENASEACASLSDLFTTGQDNKVTITSVGAKVWSPVKYFGYIDSTPEHADTTRLLPVRSGVQVWPFGPEAYKLLNRKTTEEIFDLLKQSLDAVLTSYAGFTRPKQTKSATFDAADSVFRDKAYKDRQDGQDTRKYFLKPTAPAKKRPPRPKAAAPPASSVPPASAAPPLLPPPVTSPVVPPPTAPGDAASNAGPGPGTRPASRMDVDAPSDTTAPPPPPVTAFVPVQPVMAQPPPPATVALPGQPVVPVVMAPQPPVPPQRTLVLPPAERVPPSAGTTERGADAKIWWELLDGTSTTTLTVYLTAALHSSKVSDATRTMRDIWVYVCLPFATDITREGDTVEDILADFHAAVETNKQILSSFREDYEELRQSLFPMVIACVPREGEGVQFQYVHNYEQRQVDSKNLQELSATDAYGRLLRSAFIDEAVSRFHLKVLVFRRPVNINQMLQSARAPLPKRRRTDEPSLTNGYHHYCQQRTRGRSRGLTMAPVHRATSGVHAMDGIDRVLSLAAPLLRTTRDDAYLVPARGLLSADQEQRLLGAVTTAGRKAPSIIAAAFKKLRVEDYQQHNELRGSVAVEGTVLHHKHSALVASRIALRSSTVKKLRVLIVSPASHGSPPVPTPLTAYLRQTLLGLTGALAAAWAS